MTTDAPRPQPSPTRRSLRAALVAPALPVLIVLIALALAACSREPAPVHGDTEPAARAGHETRGPSVGPPAIVWRRFRDPVERVVIGPAGVAMGVDDGRPLVIKVFASPERAADLRGFVRAWAPFVAKTGVGPLRFEGRGEVKAAPAERRMVVEWARRVAVEAVGEPGGAASVTSAVSGYGLALAWHRGEAGGRTCDRLAVDLTGEVRAATCAGGGRERRARIGLERLARLYAWFDGVRPFQLHVDRSESGAGAPVHLLFAGRGDTPAAAGVEREIERFAADLHRELLGPVPPPEPAPAARPRPPRPRRPAPSPAAPEPPPPPTEPGGPVGQGRR